MTNGVSGIAFSQIAGVSPIFGTRGELRGFGSPFADRQKRIARLKEERTRFDKATEKLKEARTKLEKVAERPKLKGIPIEKLPFKTTLLAEKQFKAKVDTELKKFEEERDIFMEARTRFEKEASSFRSADAEAIRQSRKIASVRVDRPQPTKIPETRQQLKQADLPPPEEFTPLPEQERFQQSFLPEQKPQVEIIPEIDTRIIRQPAIKEAFDPRFIASLEKGKQKLITGGVEISQKISTSPLFTKIEAFREEQLLARQEAPTVAEKIVPAVATGLATIPAIIPVIPLVPKLLLEPVKTTGVVGKAVVKGTTEFISATPQQKVGKAITFGTELAGFGKLGKIFSGKPKVVAIDSDVATSFKLGKVERPQLLSEVTIPQGIIREQATTVTGKGISDIATTALIKKGRFRKTKPVTVETRAISDIEAPIQFRTIQRGELKPELTQFEVTGGQFRTRGAEIDTLTGTGQFRAIGTREPTTQELIATGKARGITRGFVAPELRFGTRTQPFFERLEGAGAIVPERFTQRTFAEVKGDITPFELPKRKLVTTKEIEREQFRRIFLEPDTRVPTPELTAQQRFITTEPIDTIKPTGDLIKITGEPFPLTTKIEIERKAPTFKPKKGKEKPRELSALEKEAQAIGDQLAFTRLQKQLQKEQIEKLGQEVGEISTVPAGALEVPRIEAEATKLLTAPSLIEPTITAGLGVGLTTFTGEDVEQAFSLKETTAQIEKQTSRLGQERLTRTRLEQIGEQITIQAPALEIKQEQLLEPIQAITPRTTTKQKTRLGLTEPPIAETIIPTPIIIPLTSEETEKDLITLPAGSKSFQTFAKTKGKFEKIGKPTTRDEALDLGAEFVDRTPSARFKLEASKEAPKRNRERTQNFFFANRPKFRSFKVKKGTRIPLKQEFIEKTTFRIDTQGEKEGITFKGLKAKKRKAQQRAFLDIAVPQLTKPKRKQKRKRKKQKGVRFL